VKERDQAVALAAVSQAMAALGEVRDLLEAVEPSLGQADWLWHREMNTHVPCCTQLLFNAGYDTGRRR